jgi:hypothetical protein
MLDCHDWSAGYWPDECHSTGRDGAYGVAGRCGQVDAAMARTVRARRLVESLLDVVPGQRPHPRLRAIGGGCTTRDERCQQKNGKEERSTIHSASQDRSARRDGPRRPSWGSQAGGAVVVDFAGGVPVP